jgi:hypothetical protein
MFEVNWCYTADLFTGCTVTPITVTRIGVLPGATLPSITAKDNAGRAFNGSIDMYFETEHEAWGHARLSLEETVAAQEQEISELQADNDRMRAYIASIPRTQNP